jgi:hypothetical protein
MVFIIEEPFQVSFLMLNLFVAHQHLKIAFTQPPIPLKNENKETSRVTNKDVQQTIKK